MKKVNNVSGGKTSAYLAANYPADYNVFALVRTNDKNCIYPDKNLRKVVSDKIGQEFIGTLEDDIIIHTMLDLEQYLGQEIVWVTNENSFEEIIEKEKSLPNLIQRFCTSQLKIDPLQNWWYNNFDGPVEVRLGFRANETKRQLRTLESLNERGFVPAKIIIGKHKNGNNKWQEFDWQKPKFPLIENNIYKDTIEQFWKDKPVRFASMNNCVGCFHRNPILLRKQFDWHPNKMQWFVNQEEKAFYYRNHINGQRNIFTQWKKDFLYETIRKHKLQLDLFESDFNECDSGYCGL